MKLTITRPDGSSVCIEGTAAECEWFAPDVPTRAREATAVPAEPDGYQEFFRKTWLGAFVRLYGRSACGTVKQVRFVGGLGECFVSFPARPRWLRAAMLEMMETAEERAQSAGDDGSGAEADCSTPPGLVAEMTAGLGGDLSENAE